MLHGYDLAAYQPGIDWSAVVADFVIAKATESTGWVDRLFGSHIVGALSRGIPWGGYHFAHPPENSPEAEAQHFLDVCKTGQIAPSLDVETYGPPDARVSPLAVMGAGPLAQWCDRWAQVVHDATGQPPLFYSFRSYMSQIAPLLTGPWAGIWLATASGVPDGANLGHTYGSLAVLIEQWGSPSREPGFISAVDANVAAPSLNLGDSMSAEDVAAITRSLSEVETRISQRLVDSEARQNAEVARLLAALEQKIGTTSTGGAAVADLSVTGTLHLQ